MSADLGLRAPGRPQADPLSVERVDGEPGADRDPAGGSSKAHRPDPRRVPPRAPAAPGLGRGGYVAGLDGIRALAAVAVLVYHLGLGYLPGGLLGVDVFFVLSGFLITALLLGEHERTGRIVLHSFWVRRLRRLLPALLLVLLTVAGYAAWAAPPSQRGSIRADALSTLGYVANWRFAFSHQSYFHGFDAPSPLLHTWSLGVEEQFYLLWPLVVVLVLWLRRRRGGGARALAWLAGTGALASAGVAAWLTETGADASRVYYGTDTRCQALLVGAAAAAALATRRVKRGRGAVPARPGRPWRWTLVGLLGAAGVGTCWALVSGQSPLLDRGGFLLVAVAAVAVVAAVSEHPGGIGARLLSIPPLRALGRMSYGVYLWHWPIVLICNHERTGLSGLSLAGVRVVATLVVAAASYRFVERPVREGGLRRLAPTHLGPLNHLAVPMMSIVTVVAVVGSGTAGASGAAGTGATASSASLDKLAAQVQSTAGGAPPAPSLVVPPAPVATPRLLVVGDSVALTLGVGLSEVQKQYGVNVVNRGWVGCGVARGSQATDGRTIWPAWSDCAVWPSHWAGWVHQYHPAVAALMAGRWEVVDRLVNGRWTHLGDPAFDSYLAGELDTAVATLSSEGARVILFTAPYYRKTELPDGSTSVADDPARIDRFNELIREAAARHPHVAWVVDANAILCPGGRYIQKINGVDVRFPGDGIHITEPGDKLVARVALPLVRRLATDTGPATRGF